MYNMYVYTYVHACNICMHVTCMGHSGNDNSRE